MSESEKMLEDVIPKPEEFIKSIAEQGYKLGTAIADLIDNSISAGADKVEVLLDTETRPFTLFIADNGHGMDEEMLKSAMQLPSSSIDVRRKRADLGRFGLGLKTASFSQTRHFTVLSRQNEAQAYCGRTWDVELLRKHGWVLKIESNSEIEKILSDYKSASTSHLGEFDKTFNPRTIVIWNGLYKFEDFIAEHDCADVLKMELTDIARDHLSLVFHRFMERAENPLQIRLNNIRVKPFNPFPPSREGIRRLALKNRKLGEDEIKVEGFVLPTRSIDEVKSGSNPWVPQGKSLMDLEGIYMYRADRLILFGGWHGLSARSQRMQLARMRVEIGNAVDHLLHLNIAKSKVEMPHDLKEGFREYILELKIEAEREYFNRTVRRFESGANKTTEPFITSSATNRGAQMKVNSEFPLILDLKNSLDNDQKTHLKTILRMFNTELNNIRRVHEDSVFTGVDEDDSLTTSELTALIRKLLERGFDVDYLKSEVIKQLGYRFETLPDEVSKMLS